MADVPEEVPLFDPTSMKKKKKVVLDLGAEEGGGAHPQPAVQARSRTRAHGLMRVTLAFDWLAWNPARRSGTVSGVGHGRSARGGGTPPQAVLSESAGRVCTTTVVRVMDAHTCDGCAPAGWVGAAGDPQP